MLGVSLIAITSYAVAVEEKPASKTQTVKAGGITFEAPASWKSLPATSVMRKAVLSVPAPKGGTDVAELVVFAFPGGAGSVEANIDRWESQFKKPGGGSPKAETKKVKGKNVDVTRVAVGGEYTNTQTKEVAKSDYRLLGGIIETPEVSYFLKLVGPKAVVDGAEKDFDTLLTTITGPGK